MPKKVYWDTNCFLGWFQQESDKRAALKVQLEKAEAGELVIVTSAVTITECGGRPTIRRVENDASAKMLAFFENDYIAIRTVDRQTATNAHEYSRIHGLRHLDAIHMATAVVAGVEVMYTYDAAKGGRSGILTHNGAAWLGGLLIERPPDPVSGTVFDPANA